MISVTELGETIKKVNPSLSLTMIEVGARQIEGEIEASHLLLDIFPNSKMIAFELNKEDCTKMNQQARRGLTYYPVALGRKNEQRTLYETVHPMCTSLYEPNEDFMNYYHALEVSSLKEKSLIQTESLDVFLKKEGIQHIDFIKIDVQGAEVDVFKGAKKALKSTLLIVSEVEFVPLYKTQPLFGDVSKYLDKKGFMFHKFLGLAGRSLKPITLNNDPYFASQHMWSDAVFIRHIRKCKELSSDELLKLSLFSYMYNSPDLTGYCLKIYDEREGSSLFNELLTS